MAFRAAVSILTSFQKSPSVFKQSIGGRSAGILSLCNQIKLFSGSAGNSISPVQQNLIKVQKISDFNGYVLQSRFHSLSNLNSTKPLLSVDSKDLCQDSKRSVTRCSLRKGKRKTVKTILRRFYRLEWGAWIRPRGGRFKSLYKKTDSEIKRRRAHVFCNSTQSWMFDKMVNKFWRKRKYYVDDPYESYHKRSSFWATKNL